MKPYTPDTDKGRRLAGDDIHHRTANQPRKAAAIQAKRMRHAARQQGRRVAGRMNE